MSTVGDPYKYRHRIVRRDRGVNVFTLCGFIVEFEPQFSDGTDKPDCPLCQEAATRPMVPPSWIGASG